jgi:hypothetical protein
LLTNPDVKTAILSDAADSATAPTTTALIPKTTTTSRYATLLDPKTLFAPSEAAEQPVSEPATTPYSAAKAYAEPEQILLGEAATDAAKPAMVQPDIVSPPAESETSWEVKRLPLIAPDDTGEVKQLTNEAEGQDPIIMSSVTPKVMANPEIIEQSLATLQKSRAADAYGAGTVTDADATKAATYAPALLTQAGVTAQDLTQGMDHESLVQTAAQNTAIQQSIKPLIPPATSSTTEKAMQTVVTTMSADKSSTQELQIGKQGVQYMQNALEAGRPPVMPDPAVPVTPDMPLVPEYRPAEPPLVSAPTMAKIKKYGPYVAAGVVAILLLKR